MRIIKLCFILLLSLFFSRSHAQDSLKSIAHYVSFKTQFVQIKDAFNYGLVFNGLNLAGAYSLEISIDKSIFSYSPDLAFGASYKKGIGLAWRFKPVDLYYGWTLNKSESKPLTLGPYFATCYQWQLYPELQSGQMFWFSSIEVGPKLIFSFPIKTKSFKINFSNALCGWSSRPVPATETTFYSLKFSDFIENTHRNLEFGFNNLFNHTTLVAEMLNSKGKRLSLAYEFEYFGYYNEPNLYYIIHSFNLKWRVGKIKTNK